MADILERLRFDATRCELQFSNLQHSDPGRLLIEGFCCPKCGQADLAKFKPRITDIFAGRVTVNGFECLACRHWIKDNN